MGTARDFHVKTGLVVDGGNVTLSNGNLLVNSGHVDIDNIKIDGQTISTITGNEDINITPHGSGSVVLAKVDINAGTIDGATIATSDITVGSSKTLDVSAGTLTLANDQISGDKVSGGTIGTTTITALAGDLSLGDNNITNVGDLNADSISVDAAGTGLNVDFSGGNTATSKLTLGDNLADALNITEGSNSYMKFVTTNSSEQIVFGKNSTFNGTTIADLGTVTTANIDGGSIDGTTIGANSAAAGTFAAIVGTTIDASTDFTVGSTVITDDSIVMTPSSGDTLSITSAANGESTIATVDGSGSLAAHLHLDADGAINLKFNSNTKLATATGGVNITGSLDVTGSIDDVTNVTATGFVHSAHARMRESTGVLDRADIAGSSSGTHKVVDIDGTNFYTSETIVVTEVSGRSKLPSATGGAGAIFGTNEANVGNVDILALALGDLSSTSNDSSLDIFHAAEAFCAMSIQTDGTNGDIVKRVINKIYGYVNASGEVETILEHESGDIELGRFVWMIDEDRAGSTEDCMTLVFQYTSKYTHTSNDKTTYSVNVNGLSMGGAGG